jgi:hypothetical protein
MSQGIPEMPGGPPIAYAFPEMPRQLQNKISMIFILTTFKFWEKAKHLKYSSFKMY